jgi:hypothetical protein
MIFIQKSKSGRRFRVARSVYSKYADECIVIPLSGWFTSMKKAEEKLLELKEEIR